MFGNFPPECYPAGVALGFSAFTLFDSFRFLNFPALNLLVLHGGLQTFVDGSNQIRLIGNEGFQTEQMILPLVPVGGKANRSLQQHSTIRQWTADIGKRSPDPSPIAFRIDPCGTMDDDLCITLPRVECGVKRLNQRIVGPEQCSIMIGWQNR